MSITNWLWLNNLDLEKYVCNFLDKQISLIEPRKIRSDKKIIMAPLYNADEKTDEYNLAPTSVVCI